MKVNKDLDDLIWDLDCIQCAADGRQSRLIRSGDGYGITCTYNHSYEAYMEDNMKYIVFYYEIYEFSLSYGWGGFIYINDKLDTDFTSREELLFAFKRRANLKAFI